MTFFNMLVFLLAQFVREAVRVISIAVSPVTYEPVLATIRGVLAQVVGIQYINDKMPCSATGGTA